MERETATAHLSGQVWRHVVIAAAMVSALVAGVVAVADRTMVSEPGVIETRLEAPPIDPSCRELLAMPKWGWVCEDRRP
jgi:anti-sigma-K factor RskA